VVAVEPNPQYCQNLRRLAGVCPVYVENCAAGDLPGKATLRICDYVGLSTLTNDWYDASQKSPLNRDAKWTGTLEDNAHVESFNGTLRAECLDVHWFTTLIEAKQVIESWRREYNESRPHRSLGERTPSEFACQIALNGDLPSSQAAENSS
jgi:hypothetical protein